MISMRLQVRVKGEDITFALKIIKKKHVVENRQEEHIHSERRILAEARSPFVVKSFSASHTSDVEIMCFSVLLIFLMTNNNFRLSRLIPVLAAFLLW